MYTSYSIHILYIHILSFICITIINIINRKALISYIIGFVVIVMIHLFYWKYTKPGYEHFSRHGI